MDEARVEAFRSLKPICVELSQLALKCKTKRTNGKFIVSTLEALYSMLQVKSRRPDALDAKLADYVFFPLSQIFRDVENLPIRVVELALQCLQTLLLKGWKTHILPDMSRQLLILLCFIAEGGLKESKVKDVNEELGTVAFECLTSLFQTSGNAGLTSNGSIRIENAPILGHTVSVMLDGLAEGPSVKVRLAALTSLHNMVVGISDKEALKNVFPGMVSSLTKVLSAKSTFKPSYQEIITGLQVLQNLFCKVLSDDENSAEANRLRAATLKATTENMPANPWLDATASQVKMALANIMPLRYHERAEVQQALSQLCVSILENSRASLYQSVGMTVDTLVIIRSHPCTNTEDFAFNINRVLAEPSFLETLKDSLHNWTMALPRIVQSSDDIRKQRTIDQISAAYSILQIQGVSLDTLHESISISLRASVSAAIEESSKKMIGAASATTMEMTKVLQLTKATSISTTFSDILFSESSSGTTMQGVQRLVRQSQDTAMSNYLPQSICSSLRTSSGNEQLAALWLSLQVLSHHSDNVFALDQYLNLATTQDLEQPLLDEVYSFALSTLSTSSFDSDDSTWQLQALSLEVVSLQARAQKQDFRPELVDALYPILERLGSNNAALQQHAMTCLNVVSGACEYLGSAALIIDNADYLVNAISLKLNTFDISPQAPQVLVMMNPSSRSWPATTATQNSSNRSSQSSTPS
ncbi:MAG: hypothetical protein Q9164_003169 [Protoblastenia rupestris]